MDINPYQAPQIADQSDASAQPIPQRSWFRLAIGACSCCIALFLSAVGFTAPQGLRGAVSFWLVMGYFAASFAAMGAGMFMRRDKLALFGFILFAFPLGARIVYLLIR